MRYVICIDCGASSTKWTLQSADGIRKTGSTNFLTGHIFNETEWQRVIEIFRGIRLESGPVDEVVIGVTGLDDSNQVSKQLKLHLKSIFGASSVKLMNDMQLAYSAFLSPGEGVFIYGGTGAVAASIDKDGNFHRAGGRGYLIADEGGGFWIGQQALRHVTSQWDVGNFDWGDPLTALTMEKANSKNWDELREFVYGGGRQAVASLAPVVAYAKLKGSKDAELILLEAGKFLAKIALELQNRIKVEKFVAMGGVFKIDSTIFDSLTSRLNQDIALVESEISQAWLVRNCKNQ
jgi:glucosamine kinase